MKIAEIASLLGATMLCGDDKMDTEVLCACGSDLMSDVLAFSSAAGVLITGLLNPQVVRTAEMMDIKCIVFGRNKTPDAGIIALARERDIALMTCSHGMMNCCGILYQAGLRGED